MHNNFVTFAIFATFANILLSLKKFYSFTINEDVSAGKVSSPPFAVISFPKAVTPIALIVTGRSLALRITHIFLPSETKSCSKTAFRVSAKSYLARLSGDKISFAIFSAAFFKLGV